MGEEGIERSITVRHFCSYPGKGGAGIAADRVVRGLLAEGVEAELVGIHPQPYADYVRSLDVVGGIRASLRRRWRALQIEHMKKAITGQSRAGSYFFVDRSTHGLDLAHSVSNCKVVHFHWMSQLIDFVDTFKNIPEGVSIVWTMHDMNVFTGGCTYNLDCQGYRKHCRECPQQENGQGQREVFLNHNRKKKALEGLKNRISIVTPSKWMAGQVEGSSLLGQFRCEVIPNGIDQTIFNPCRRATGRKRLGMKSEEKVILFVAASIDNPLKGMALLQEVLPEIEQVDRDVRVVVLGNSRDGDWQEGWHWLGSVKEESSLAEIYAGSDILVVPSMADNFPNVIGEALSCGLPVVASNVGGIPEMVKDGESGRLFEKGSAASLRRVLKDILVGMPDNRKEWAEQCRKLAEERISLKDCAREHKLLYEGLL